MTVLYARCHCPVLMFCQVADIFEEENGLDSEIPAMEPESYDPNFMVVSPTDAEVNHVCL
jgi:hypothetical protein